MFTYNQTQQMEKLAKSKNLRICKSYNLESLIVWLREIFGNIENPEFTKLESFYNLHKEDVVEEKGYWEREMNKLKLSQLNNLLALSERHLSEVIIKEATTLYFTNPQELTDLICETMNKNYD